MLKAVARKEWLKLNKAWWIIAGLNLMISGYLYVRLNHLFTVEHAEMIWYRSFELGTLYYELVKYLMVATGTILGLAQFLPEMTGHRFRLSLHLPVNENSLVLLSLLVGIVSTAVIGMLDALCLFGALRVFFPAEGALSGLLTAMPWLFAGFVAYLGTALVLLEPEPFRKLVCLGVTVGFVCFFFHEGAYETYNRAFPRIAVLSLLFVPAVLLPAHRYRNRRSA